MSNRKLTILGLIALLTVIWAIAQSKIANRPKSHVTVPRYLIQGLDPDQIAGIVIGTGQDQVILNRRKQTFVVASKDDYPALSGEINELISNCLDSQPTEFYTDDPLNHKDLEVNEEDARYVVKFYDKDSALITGIVVGKLKEKGRGTYIRRVDDNSVYVSPKTPWIKKRALDYVAQELTSVKHEDIESVTVASPNEIYTLDSFDDGKTAFITGLPEGKKLKTSIANKVLTALTNLRFDDVKKLSADDKDLAFDSRYACRLRDSTVYTIKIAKHDNKTYAVCTAEFTDKTPITKTQGQVESEEQLREKEARLLARDNAENFAEKHAGWLYEIPTYRADNLTKKLAELLEDIPKPKAEEKTDLTDKDIEHLQEEIEEQLEQFEDLTEPPADANFLEVAE